MSDLNQAAAEIQSAIQGECTTPQERVDRITKVMNGLDALYELLTKPKRLAAANPQEINATIKTADGIRACVTDIRKEMVASGPSAMSKETESEIAKLIQGIQADKETAEKFHMQPRPPGKTGRRKSLDMPQRTLDEQEFDADEVEAFDEVEN